jgi:hypothetical protein
VSVNDLETAVARREIAHYLKQSETMLADVMQSCSQDEISPWEVKLQSDHARQLLQQKRFFNGQLDQVSFAKLKNVCGNIDSVCYELVSLPHGEQCEGLARIRSRIKSENTLLKVRVLEKELSSPQTSEV